METILGLVLQLLILGCQIAVCILGYARHRAAAEGAGAGSDGVRAWGDGLGAGRGRTPDAGADEAHDGRHEQYSGL